MCLSRSTAALVVLVMISPAAIRAQQPIGENEVEKWIAEQSQCDDLDQIHIIKLADVDFTKDGRAQAIVVAMSCTTGTAGPDVQSVLARSPNGNLVELGAPVDQKTIEDAPLFGPGNVDLDSEDGMLVLRYADSSGRENPFIIKFKWNGKQFEQVAIVSSKPFPTSYDCRKADEDVERAVCYVKSLADFDLDLAAAYKRLLNNTPSPRRTSLREEQRKWLSARDADCDVNHDKWFVGCLEALYTKRIAELRKANSLK